MPEDSHVKPQGLSDAQLSFYREHGYLRYGPLLDPTEVIELQEIIERLYAETNQDAIELATGEGKYALFTPVFTRVPRYAELIHRHPVLLNVLESILGPVFRLVEDQLFYKPPHHGAPLAFHHDNIYYGFTDPQIVTCWIALDGAIPENGCLQILPGSHREETEHRNVSGTIIQEAVIDSSRLVVVTAKAGELVLFDGLTVHGSGPNTTDAPRRVANLVAITPCPDGIHRKFSDEENPYLRGSPAL
jgi:hypothetical protein